jgi:hypothetical protein
LDFNHVTLSVEHIKKIHDRAENVKPVTVAAAMWAAKTPGPSDLLQKYSEILTNAFVTLKSSPLQNTVPLSLQTCLTMSKKILDTLEGADKKDLGYEKISSMVSTSTAASSLNTISLIAVVVVVVVVVVESGLFTLNHIEHYLASH